ncbi:hypothetical protein, partial [Sulfobacillus harzensis]
MVARLRLAFAPSSTALAKLVVQGWGTHIATASLQDAGTGHQRVRVAGNLLWPTQLLPPHHPVRLEVTVSGFLDWRVRRVITVTTPASPQVVADRVRVNVGKRPTARFSSAVAQVRFAATDHVKTADGHHVAIGPVVEVPNQQGSITVQVRARAWETWGSDQTLHWASVPWLTATAVQVTKGHANLSTAPIDVTFSAPVRRSGLAQWSMAPTVAGHWHQVTDRTWQFQPTSHGWAPDTTLVLHLPEGKHGLVARDGAQLARASQTLTVQLPEGTTLRLQQWLAELGYLPVRWTSAAGAHTSPGWDSVYQPPTGQFTWRYPAVPTALKSLWNPRYWTAMTQAAVIAFQHQQ